MWLKCGLERRVKHKTYTRPFAQTSNSNTLKAIQSSHTPALSSKIHKHFYSVCIQFPPGRYNLFLTLHSTTHCVIIRNSVRGRLYRFRGIWVIENSQSKTLLPMKIREIVYWKSKAAQWRSSWAPALQCQIPGIDLGHRCCLYGICAFSL